MQTVTVTVDSKDFTFDVYNRNELDRKSFMNLVSANSTNVTRIGAEEWSDSEMARIEKMAAKQAGLSENDNVVTVWKNAPK